MTNFDRLRLKAEFASEATMGLINHAENYADEADYIENLLKYNSTIMISLPDDKSGMYTFKIGPETIGYTVVQDIAKGKARQLREASKKIADQARERIGVIDGTA